MHINEKSWHFKFSRWTYGEYYRPSHGCPYFWKILLAILISPLVLLFKGLTRINIDIETPNWDVSYKIQCKIWKGFKIFLLVLAVLIIMILYDHDSYVMISVLYIVGLLALVAGACIGIGYMLYKFVPKLYDATWGRYRETHKPREWNIHTPNISLPKRKHRERKPNLLISMIKGWYSHNCPAIEYY